MIFYLIGIDYRTTPLSAREQAYQWRQNIIDFWQENNKEAAVLFTCNRIEVYGVGQELFSITKDIYAFQNKFPTIFDSAYVKIENEQVVRHALRLACGLESQLKGEEQITRQIELWVNKDFYPQSLKKLWLPILKIARNIRLESGLDEQKTDISDCVLEDLYTHIDPKREIEVVLIGTGKIAQLFSKEKIGVVKLHFVSRKKHSRAKQLAMVSGGRALLLKNLSSALLTADALVSATASPHYLVGKELLSKIIQKRNKPLYIYDVSVPRDIDPNTKDIPGVYLQSLDDLAYSFRHHNLKISSCIKRAESLIERAVLHFSEVNNVYSFKGGDAPQPACLKAS